MLYMHEKEVEIHNTSTLKVGEGLCDLVTAVKDIGFLNMLRNFDQDNKVVKDLEVLLSGSAPPPLGVLWLLRPTHP